MESKELKRVLVCCSFILEGRGFDYISLYGYRPEEFEKAQEVIDFLK